jgi:hypothetical protein
MHPPKPDTDGDNNNSHTSDDPDVPLPFTRPQTPPQSSNHLPWSSYHDLPPDHPVFRYPDEVREKMYAKGVGACEPLLLLSLTADIHRIDVMLTSFMFDMSRPGSQSRDGPRAPG